MLNNLKASGLTAGAFLISTQMASAAPVDLSTWAGAEGAGNWTIAADNNSVFQSQNSDPGVFYDATASQGQQLSGEITVETNFDDDLVGFVLGYQSGDLTAASTDYILIDWKQTTQPFYSACDDSIDGLVGLSISRVTGDLNPQDAWCHNGDVQELQRGATLGSTGWNDNQTYTFDLIFQANNIQVFVDGNKEIDINGTFANGGFGFYNYSQSNVRYAGLTQVAAPTPPVAAVPLPAGALLMGTALAGLGIVRRRRK